MNSVIWTGQQFIAVGYDGVMVASADGISWSPVATGIDDTLPLWGIAWSGSNSVVLGYGGKIYTSP